MHPQGQNASPQVTDRAQPGHRQHQEPRPERHVAEPAAGTAVAGRPAPRLSPRAGRQVSRRRGGASIAGSPVLIGALTTLIVIVAVFLSYNANSGLPFVPTYDVSIELPNAANLVEGNEVRLGGFRIGAVNTIKPIRRPDGTAFVAHRPEAAEERREPPARHDGARPLALGARPEVRRDHPRQAAEGQGLPRRVDDPARPGDARARSSSTRSSTPSTARRASVSRTRCAASATRSRDAARTSTRRSASCRQLLSNLEPAAANLNDMRTQFDRLLPGARAGRRDHRAGRRHQRRPVRQPRHDVRRARPRRAPVHPGDDLARPGRARRRHPRLPGAARAAREHDRVRQRPRAGRGRAARA